MRVFVTGATGYIGSAVTAALRGAGHQVVGLARSDDAAERLAAAGAEVRHGDLAEPATLAAGARDVEGVIHTANSNDERAGAADRAAVTAMLAALAGSGKPFVYTSGIWVLGDTGGREVDEDEPLHPLSLVAWRPAVEELVLAAGGDGVRATVVRPGIVYGHGGGIPAMLVAAARDKGVVRTVGSGDNHWPLVFADDLADLYRRMLERAEAGSLFHAAAEHRTQKEVAEAAATAGGAEGRVEAWPLDEARGKLGGFADALALDQRISSARARAQLGWEPRGPALLDELRAGSYAG
jgi:nucleoside-diphosphate-sugar epimerase